MRRYIYLVILNFVHQCIHEAVAVADLSDFFPYGDINLDTPLFRNDDQYSTPQNISVEFTFFTERHSQLYVSNYSNLRESQNMIFFVKSKHDLLLLFFFCWNNLCNY